MGPFQGRRPLLFNGPLFAFELPLQQDIGDRAASTAIITVQVYRATVLAGPIGFVGHRSNKLVRNAKFTKNP